MRGEFSLSMTTLTTHVIAGSTDSAKYQVRLCVLCVYAVCMRVFIANGYTACHFCYKKHACTQTRAVAGWLFTRSTIWYAWMSLIQKSIRNNVHVHTSVESIWTLKILMSVVGIVYYHLFFYFFFYFIPYFMFIFLANVSRKLLSWKSRCCARSTLTSASVKARCDYFVMLFISLFCFFYVSFVLVSLFAIFSCS